jgi:hypothetical protein
MPARSVRLLLVLGLLVLGCSDSRPSPTDDGGIPMPPDAASGETCEDNTDPRTVDFFGEACTAAPYPVNTTCHDDHGWCIDGVCHPMCVNACPRCPGGGFQFAPAGACYCVPPM